MGRAKWSVVACVLSLILVINGGARTPEEIPRVVPSPVLVSQLTGAKSPARTEERWNIAGTDLGFSFQHQNDIYLTFGDTWGRGGAEGPDWRSNTMAIANRDPDHGYVLTDVISGDDGNAKELLHSLKKPGEEYTVIPTAGTSVGDRMYLHYMSIRDWIPASWGYKHPAVNGAGFAYSDNGGRTWVKDETARWSGDTAFTQTAMVKNRGYVYVFGTPAGRFGPAKLMRVDQHHLLHPVQYEYWNGEHWTEDPGQAIEVVPAPVGELSVRWSPHHKKWLMMYRNEATGLIVLRTAGWLTGPWDEERTIVTSTEYPSNYAPFMLPIAGPNVYFTMSIYNPGYQVYVMRLPL